jgi:hypothetical protein
MSGEKLSMPSKSELERSQAEITWLPEPLHRNKPDKSLWSGTISASAEKLAGRLKLKSLEEYKEKAKDYYYKISELASVRCIDGRISKTAAAVENREELLCGELGPQTPGGSPVVAVSHRIAEWESLEWGDITHDVTYTTQLYDAHNLPSPVGGHDDDNSEFPNTGCGAIDKMPEIIDRIVNPQSREILRHYVEAITEDDFDESEFELVMERYQVLASPEAKRTYLLQTPDGEYQYKHLTLEVLKDIDLTGEPDSVETMVGSHNEIAVIVNKIKGTTFHRDLFNFDSGSEAQIFNYDYWHSRERAKEVYADSPAQRKRFLIARALYTVGTCMVLTDGSLAVGIRQ